MSAAVQYSSAAPFGSAAEDPYPLAAATAVVAVPDPQLRQGLIDALGKTSTQVIDDAFHSGNIGELAELVDRSRPSVVFLGLAAFSEDAPAAVARIAGLASAPRVVAVTSAPSPELILKTMRAGAAEFVYPPFEPDFEAVLCSVLSDVRMQPDPVATGKVIAFVSAKGGCGATTLACHSAAWLKTIARKEVLLADLDISAGISATLMQSNGRYSLDDALQNLHRMDLRFWKALVSTTPSGVELLPSAADPAPVLPISRKLPPLLRFWRTHYEWTILDLGRGITPALPDVLASIDTLALIATNEIPALRQSRQMIQYLGGREFGTNRLKLVLNQVARRAPVAIPELEKIIGVPIHSVIPNDYALLQDAWSHPRLIDLNVGLGRDFSAFTARLTGVGQPEKKRRRLFTFRLKNFREK